MKKFIYFFIGLWLISACKPARELSKPERLALLTKTWGLMKYYHPDIGLGNIDWDSVFIASARETLSAQSEAEFARVIDQLINSPATIESPGSSTACRSDSTIQSVDFGWINNSVFVPENVNSLNSLLLKKTSYKNKYVSDSVGARSLGYARFYEDPMEEADLGEAPLRLLGFARYWNIVEYFFPYKNLIDKNWNDVLTEYIPMFLEAKNKEEYYKTLLLLSSDLNDGHANIPYHPELRSSFFGRHRVPFSLKIVEDQLLVSSFVSDSIEEFSLIQKGDVVKSIDDISTDERRRELGEFLPNPNEVFLNSEVARYILNGNSNSVEVNVLRNDSIKRFDLPRYTFAEVREFRNETRNPEPWEVVREGVIKAHMGVLNQEHLETFFQAASNTSHLVLDFRHYPNWQVLSPILGFFHAQKTDFYLSKSQCLDRPGLFSLEMAGSDNIGDFEGTYDGSVIILVDEETLSFGEYFVMALQVLDNVTVVGSHTAGEDGNQVGIDMPGGMRMFFSSLGIYYPDGSNTQRLGIKLDHEVAITVDDLRADRDSVLDFAIGLTKLK